MKIFITIILVLALLCAYTAYSFVRKVRTSRALADRAVPYSLVGERGVSVLVLGDSTAVGVGADKPDESLPAHLARKVGATQLDNFAVSGARVRDLAHQVQNIRKEKYNYILIGIGANDVIRFGDASEVAQHLKVILSGLPVRDHLIVYMAGDIGATQLFPRFLNDQYSNRTHAFHAAFNEVVSESGGTYVNLYEEPNTDPFRKDPKTYLAADGLHPTSAGYKLWFERMSAALDV